MKKNNEIVLQEADNVIMEFFAGDLDSSALFVEVAFNMIEASPKACVRYNDGIIGVAVPGERYRFYITKKNGICSIKYKHHTESHPFVQEDKEKYITYNIECNAYFVDHPELKVSVNAEGKSFDNDSYSAKTKRTAPIYDKSTGDKNEVKHQWSLVLAHSEAAIEAEKLDVDNDVLQAYYNEIHGLLIDFSKAVLPERECDIVIRRILNHESVTLQTIGEQYGITRERVRQLEVKKWRTITNGFHRSSRTVFSEWRQNLCDILLKIGVSHYIQAMAYFLKENARIGEFIIQVSTPTYKPDAYQAAITQYSYKRKLVVKPGERIPAEIVDQVRNIDILPFIQRHQELVQQGENYKGICRSCSAKALVVYPNNNSFYCFSCKAGGNIITYLTEYENIDYRAAVLKLAEMYHIGETDTFVPTNIVMKEAALYFHDQLRNNSGNRKAIGVIHSWGISGKSIVKLGLGYNDERYESALKYLTEEKSISVESLLRDNIIAKSEKGNYYDRMRNSVIIPTIDASGNVVCFDYYVIEKGSFVHYPPSQGFFRKDNLYSLNLAAKASKKSVVVVSDYRSYFALASNGIFNVVSTYMPQISDAQLDLLKRYFKVIILAVNQAADYSNCRRYCQNNDMYCEQLHIEGDVTEYLSNNGESVREKIEFFESIFNS